MHVHAYDRRVSSSTDVPFHEVADYICKARSKHKRIIVYMCLCGSLVTTADRSRTLKQWTCTFFGSQV